MVSPRKFIYGAAMKTAIAVLFAAVSLVIHSAASEIVTLSTSNQTVLVSPTDVVQIITVVLGDSNRSILFQKESGTFISLRSGYGEGNVQSGLSGTTLTGLTKVGLFMGDNGFLPIPTNDRLAMTIRITKAAEELFSQPVIMPAVATQDYKVELETSTDLQNWIPAVPGDYLGGTTNRFFRVKVAKKPAAP